jgi:polysaccharide deacetylase 2 family uncharacterized protein YibQ
MPRPAKKKSTSRRPKKRVTKRSSRQRPPNWFLGAVVLLLVLVTLGWWIGRGRRTEQIKVPQYEEASRNGFTVLLDEVELAIYQSLRQLEVDSSRVQFRRVVHRSKGKIEYDFTELEISLDQDQDLRQAEKRISENLASVGDSVSWKTVKKQDSNLELQIKVEDILTHRLALLKRRRQPLVQPSSPPTVRLAIVIDDLGHDGRLANRFLEIEGSLSFSVLPYGTFSGSIARKIHKAGRDLLLHLPMEPKGYPGVDPGAGALLVDMPEGELVETLRKNLDSIPHIEGVNNHMGSRFCESEPKMTLVIAELKKRDLFFLDSRTSSRTRAYGVALQLNLPAAERDVFLDNIQSPQAIRGQMRRLVRLARLKGQAIGIAHPNETTLEVLKEVVPELPGQGVKLVPISHLIHQ